MDDCIFCKIVAGEIPCHKIYEDDKHLAFLSIFPNTEGFSVVITKEHFDSDINKIPEEDLRDLFWATKLTQDRIAEKLEDVGRCGLIFEGMGVNHVHFKIFPMHGTGNMEKWEPKHSDINTYFDEYRGYISSHDSERADDEELAKLAKKIRE